MKGELVTTQTEDRVRLHGLYCAPISKRNPPFDAVVLTHGLAGNFYSSRFLFHLAHCFLDEGIHVVVGNTRGHDDVNRTVRMGRSSYMGAAYENVSDCQFDLTAWTEFLLGRGHQRVALAGHSLGAIKSLYAQAHRPHASVHSVIGLSATRLNHQRLLESSGRQLFLETLEEATRLVQADQSEQLMDIKFPFPTKMAAGAYLDKYGNSNQYDWFQFVRNIRVPILLLFGQLELEENAAFEGLQEEFPRLHQESPLLSIQTVEGADHFYSARFTQATDVIRTWISEQ